MLYAGLRKMFLLLFIGSTLSSCDSSVSSEEFISPEERLFRAVYENREQDVAEILGGGEVKNIDEIFSEMSSLQFAAVRGNSRIARMLIASGADINLSLPDDGFTPLYLAASYGRHEVVMELVNSGAEIEPVSYFGFTPLIVALRKRHTKIAKFLVESGADACAVRANNLNALQAAKAYKQPEFVDWYESRGFPVCGRR